MFDDLVRILNDKADTRQSDFVNADIKYNVDKLNLRIDFLMDIADDKHKYNEQREIHRDKNCVSCSLPARDFLNIPELKPLPPIKTRTETIGFKKGDADKIATQDDGNVCYPNRPIRHPIDPRYKFDSIFK